MAPGQMRMAFENQLYMITFKHGESSRPYADVREKSIRPYLTVRATMNMRNPLFI